MLKVALSYSSYLTVNFTATVVVLLLGLCSWRLKDFLTVIQRKVQRHEDVVIRSHTAQSQPNHTHREQSLTNVMFGERKKKTVSNLHFRTNVEVLGQFEINTFSLAETDLTRISNCHNKHKSLHFYIYQGTCH